MVSENNKWAFVIGLGWAAGSYIPLAMGGAKATVEWTSCTGEAQQSFSKRPGSCAGSHGSNRSTACWVWENLHRSGSYTVISPSRGRSTVFWGSSFPWAATRGVPHTASMSLTFLYLFWVHIIKCYGWSSNMSAVCGVYYKYRHLIWIQQSDQIVH